VLACSGIEGVSDRALAALLNSGLVAFYHRRVHADSRQRAFPQVKVGHLASLPIPRDLAPLEPLAEALEALAACQASARREVNRRLAEALGRSMQQFRGKRWWAALAGAVDAAELLTRRIPEARSQLARRRAAQEVESAVRAYQADVARLDGEMRSRRSELDAAACRAYGLSVTDADHIREHAT
jgi:hypothetical protein